LRHEISSIDDSPRQRGGRKRAGSIVILNRRRRVAEGEGGAGRRRISRCATPAETHWDSTQLGKLEIVRRPALSEAEGAASEGVQ